SGNTCVDAYKTTTCRPSAGPCDVAESCTGTSGACPADGFASPSTSCTGSSQGGACDNDAGDHCSGSGNTCVDAYKTTTCRPSAGPCDVAETCSGTSGACPMDMIKANGTPCADDLNPCTNDVCNGTDTACHHPSWPAGTSCENSDAVVCTADVCNGVGACIHTSQDARCDDHNDCTIDSCNPLMAPPDGTGCVHVARTSTSTGCSPSDASHPNSCGCNDGNVCTTGDHCGLVAINSTTFVPGCLGVPNSGVTCDDGDSCTGDTLFGGTQDTCSSKSCLAGSSETPFCKSWGQKYYSTNSGHCRSEDGACCTNFAKDKTGALRGNCCL